MMAEEESLNERLCEAAIEGNKDEVRSCLDQGADVNCKHLGITPLHLAALNGHLPVVVELLTRGANVNEKDDDGEHTPLHYAASKWHLSVVVELFTRGANIKGKDDEMSPEFFQSGLPPEVRNLGAESANIYSDLLKEETYPHFEARTMLVGEQNTGKTTIARYLVGKCPTETRRSTDGIDLYKGLSFFFLDDDDWLGGKQDYKLDDIVVSRSLQKNEFRQSEGLNRSHSGSQSSSSKHPTKTDTEINVHQKPLQSLPDRSAAGIEEVLYTRKQKETKLDQYDNDANAQKHGTGSFVSTDSIKNPGLIEKIKAFFGVNKDVDEIKVSVTKEVFLKQSFAVGKKKIHQKNIVPVIIWDFGGQDVFYSTHQTFLTYRALYIVVLDGSRNLDDPCPFEQFLPGKTGAKTPRDYIKFWINTIVTYCKGGGNGFPKILVVLTHKDKVEKNDIETRRQMMFNEIQKMFKGTPLLEHLVIEDQIFVNARDKDDPEMGKIKKTIIRLAKSQPTWGQNVPKCFIPLEMEFSNLVRKGVNLITMDHLAKINLQQPIRPLTDPELKVFLKFQHAIGTLLYFDVEGLESHIMLSPTHLIDAFRSLITDKSFLGADRKRHEAWDTMGKTGIINKNVIDDIWRMKYRHFYKNKDYLLGVMTHLDILTEPRRYDLDHKRIPAEFYYVASMVRKEDQTGYLTSLHFFQRNIALAICPVTAIIPPALSFRFISYCLSIWGVKKHGQKNEDMLFHKSAVFTIDPALDLHIQCEDDYFIIRLVHDKNRTLIIKDLSSSLRECLVSALENISQLYIKTCSEKYDVDDGSFQLNISCSAPNEPCLISLEELKSMDNTWVCPKHGIEHGKDTLCSWFSSKESIFCEHQCPVENPEFLNQTPTEIHLRRLALEYNINEIRELVTSLGLPYSVWEDMATDKQGETLRFEALRQCLRRFAVTFKDIKKATIEEGIQTPHTICKVVRDKQLDFDLSPEKWNLVTTDEDIDRLAPLVGGDSLSLLVELGMDFNVLEQIKYSQQERNLVKLNRDILHEWRDTFCKSKCIRPTLRYVANAFQKLGMNVKMVENVLFD